MRAARQIARQDPGDAVGTTPVIVEIARRAEHRVGVKADRGQHGRCHGLGEVAQHQRTRRCADQGRIVAQLGLQRLLETAADPLAGKRPTRSICTLWSNTHTPPARSRVKG